MFSGQNQNGRQLEEDSKKSGFMGRIRQKVNKKNPECYVELHLDIHQQLLYGKHSEVRMCYEN
jgi:hypothetical protein